MTPLRLLYFVNPMCSWCWGFAPVMRRLVAEHGDAIEVGVALGSLGDRSRPMDRAAKAAIAGHWEHVTALTGQPFDHGFFAREGFVYDTEPASAAVMAVRAAAPERTLAFLHGLQEAFYADNRDVRDPKELGRVAEAQGIDAASLEEALASPELRAALKAEFRETAAIGVTG